MRFPLLLAASPLGVWVYIVPSFLSVSPLSLRFIWFAFAFFSSLGSFPPSDLWFPYLFRFLLCRAPSVLHSQSEQVSFPLSSSSQPPASCCVVIPSSPLLIHPGTSHLLWVPVGSFGPVVIPRHYRCLFTSAIVISIIGVVVVLPGHPFLPWR